MNTIIYIDPKLNIFSDESIKVIIEFRVKPAKAAIAISTTGLTLEQAVQLVEKSHADFHRELLLMLESKQMAYKIIHSYKSSFNGVAMKLSGKAINELLSSKIIKAIYIDEEVRIPEKVIDLGYQI